MRLFYPHAVPALTASVLTACPPAPPAATTSTAATQDAAGNTIPTQARRHAGTQAGIRCDQGMCTVAAGTNSPRFNVELASGCQDDGLFAQVYQPGGAALHAQLPASADSTAHAQMADKQFVCVLTTASTQATADFCYVRTQDPGQLASCARADACPAPLPGPERSGWVDAAALDVFSNGLDLSQLDDAALATTSNADWTTRDSVRSGDGQFELQVLEDRRDGQRPRRVRILQTGSDGTTREIASNDRLVPCADCGGVAGDPYGYSRFDDNGLLIAIGGGSRQRWSTDTRWQWSTAAQQWQRVELTRQVTDSVSGDNRQQHLQAAQLGPVTLQSYDPATLPAQPVLT